MDMEVHIVADYLTAPMVIGAVIFLSVDIIFDFLNHWEYYRSR